MQHPLLKEPEIPGDYTRTRFYGDHLLYLQTQFPAFNFYDDKKDDMSTNTYLLTKKPVEFKLYKHYGEVKRWFLEIIKEAQDNIWKGNFGEAIFYLEYLVEHRYPSWKPYDMLIAIYKKQKDVSNEIRTLEHSITFFKDLRERQGAHIMQLAKDLKILNFILDQGTDKKIEYYGGAFVLYDPVKVMVKWEGRLELLRKLQGQ